MKIYCYFVFFIVFLISSSSIAQLDSVYYLGPRLDSVLTGAVQTTDNFTSTMLMTAKTNVREIPKKKLPKQDMFINIDKSKLSKYVYVQDKNITKHPTAEGQTVLLNNFKGYDMTNVIPPDPTIAAGPNHVIICANGQPGAFRIYDKEGNLLKTIEADDWWADVAPEESGDPQVMYDPFEGRWVLGWMYVNSSTQEASTLIAYSNNDDPLGSWYVYSFPYAGGWGDYPQLGFDDKAIYINTNQWSWSGDFQYVNMRIINKAELYASNGGSVKYKDFWDIRRPGDGTSHSALFGIHPTYSYSIDDVGYHFWSNYGSANFYCLFQVINPTSDNPRLRGNIIPVQTYQETPNANQLGGGSPLIEGSGSGCITSPIVKDGILFMTHSVGNSTNPDYSSVKYVIYDLYGSSIYEQAELGAVGYYYIFPALAVDQDYNIAVTFSRSADDEYMGAYYSTKYFNDPPGLSPSRSFAEGQGNYVITYSGTRNRWGDYMGIYLDPANNYDVWMHTEYVSETNEWSTQVGKIRMVPVPGIFAYANPESIDYGKIEVGTGSDTVSVVIANYGTDDLTINTIPAAVGDYHLLNSPALPITLSTYDSLTIELQYTPTIEGQQDTIYTITNNSSDFTGVNLKGYGWIIHPAEINQLYAFSNAQNNGNIVKIDKGNGAGTNVGPSQYTDLRSISINPNTNIIYGMRSTTTESEILRINSQLGDTYSLLTIPIIGLFSIAFDNNGDLYGIFGNREIYKINLDTGDYQLITTSEVMPVTIAFDPLTNELWASYRKPSSPKDFILKIDLATGDTTQIGQTGLGETVLDIAFDEAGRLYGIQGGGFINELLSINKSTGAGTVIGEVGLPGIRGLGYSRGEINSIDRNKSNSLPNSFALQQNYPNPFNPSTAIKFSVPENSKITLTVYNLLGQIVKVLANEVVNPGNYSFIWNGTDNSGLNVSSGIYFYELKAHGNKGNSFSKIMKMVYLK